MVSNVKNAFFEREKSLDKYNKSLRKSLGNVEVFQFEVSRRKNKKGNFCY